MKRNGEICNKQVTEQNSRENAVKLHCRTNVFTVKMYTSRLLNATIVCICECVSCMCVGCVAWRTNHRIKSQTNVCIDLKIIVKYIPYDIYGLLYVLHKSVQSSVKNVYMFVNMDEKNQKHP